MIALRFAVFLVLLVLLQSLVQARSLGHSPYPDYRSLFRRQSNVEQPRCPPRGSTRDLGSVKDDYKVPESTEEQILNGNLAAYAQFLKGEGAFVDLGDSEPAADPTIAERSTGNETWLGSLGKILQARVNNQGAARHATALVKVPTDGADTIKYAGFVDAPILSRVMSTNDLCGCTVFVVSSPFASMMLHVWERRAPGFAMQGPDSMFGGPKQERMDNEFVARGRELLNSLLSRFGSTTAEQRSWFPLDNTLVTVVAPAANPDYVDWEFWRRRDENPFVESFTVTEEIWRDMGLGDPPADFQPLQMPLRQNPVSTHRIIAGTQNKLRLIYPNAASKLLDAVSGIMVPGRPDASTIVTYRRRYANDPAHETDDRQYVAIAPYVTRQGTVATVLYYDDDKSLVLNRL